MNDIEICYVAALAEGLRLINEKALDRGVNLTKFNADALIHFVRVKGDRLVEIYELNPAAYVPTETLKSLPAPVPVPEIVGPVPLRNPKRKIRVIARKDSKHSVQPIPWVLNHWEL